ncbi:hypothetical protein J1N35_036108 [Gossypium stocksii]|uniref:RNase H type-1 domain-containing protein n=1 Tax=Gossypium stocksii TaxID=47602 RepID=A0A9D3UI75_9ROSI|nr:hypothetical protein J1N35_036108 [Gossypium stocksii]
MFQGELWLEAELWCVVEGFQIACKNGDQRIILEIDSMEVANMLSSSAKFREHRLCKEAHKHINKERYVIIQHTYREGNKLTDGLDLMGLGSTITMFCVVAHFCPSYRA